MLMKKALRILKKTLLIILAIVIPLAFLAGVVWALDFTGVINFYKFAQKVPVVGTMLPVPEDEKAVKKTPLQLENEKLRSEVEEFRQRLKKETGNLQKKINSLQKELEAKERENEKLKSDKQGLQETVDSLEIWKEEQEGQKLSYESLGRYYAEMKPAKAASIMKNLDNDVTIGILLNLEDEQVTAILSAMEDAKAAEIVNGMRQ